MKRFSTAIATAACLLTAACASPDSGTGRAAATAATKTETTDRTSASATFEKDREAILAMVGTYDVTFHFRETVALKEGYEVKEPYTTGGLEVVRVIKDTGREISLQHLLLVGENYDHVVKHWRQDWIYEPKSVLTYKGGDRWVNEDVPAGQRDGAWSQIVYQVDDSPRYGAVARWRHDQGISEWTAETWRPLPRRDATKRDDYDVMVAENTHAITPEGWVHEQVNGKLQLREGKEQLLVREIGVNTYRENAQADIGPALAYWDETSGFWAAVRDHWTELENSGKGVALTLEGEGDLYGEVLSLASDVAADKAGASDAAAKAVDAINAHVQAQGGY